MSDHRINTEFDGLPRRYEISRPLGEGGQRSVVLASDRETGREVAVASISIHGDRRSLLQQLDEARAISRLGERHHIVVIEDVIEGAERIFVISPYFAGGDLAARLARRAAGTLPVSEALEIAIHVCIGLEHAHAHRVTHCDVKPENILLDEAGNAFLGDFGLAYAATEASDALGERAGTPAYGAPEQLSEGRAHPAGDLYSLGCVLYETVTGRLPFTAETASDTLRLHMDSRPVPPAERSPEIPRALSDLILKLLEKNPRDRPQSARDVRAACEGILDAGAAGPASSAGEATPLIGRQEELGRLFEGLSQASDGKPVVALVRGEAGIGKSRLIHELAAMADGEGWQVLLGHGTPDAPLPFRTFVEALLPMSGRLAELDSDQAEQMRQLLYLGSAGIDPEMLTGREAHHHRLFGAVLAALVAFGRNRPLLVALDDIQWADSASLDLVEHLVRSLSGAGNGRGAALMLVLGSRPAVSDEPSGRTINRILREHDPLRIELEEFDEGRTFELISALAVAPPSGRILRHIYELTRGNPLFVREIAMDWPRGDADPTSSDGSAVDDVVTLLPSSIKAAVSARVGMFPVACRDWLSLSAVLGIRFELRMLRRLTGNGQDSVLDDLAPAVAHGLVAIEGRTARFSHPVIRQVVYESLDLEDRRALHIRVANDLEARGVAASATMEIEIAHHLLRAGPLAEPKRLVRHASAAADVALDRYAWHEAADLLDAAISAWQLSDDEADDLELTLAELHRKAGLAHFRRYESDSCLEHYDEAARLFRRSGDIAGLAHTLNDRARAAVWLGLIPYGDPVDVKSLEVALDELDPSDRGLRALITGTLAESYWAARQTTKAEQLARRALGLASEVEDHRLCAESCINLGLTLFGSFRAKEALSTWRVGAAHARKADDLFAEERCLQRVILAQFACGRFEEAKATAEDVQCMIHTLEVPGEASVLSSSQLAIAAVRGDYADAERHGEAALDQIRRAKYPWSAIMTVPTLVYSRAMRGSISEAFDTVKLLSEPGLMFEDPAFFEPLARDMNQLVAILAGEPVVHDTESALPRVEPDEGATHDLVQLADACTRVELADASQRPELAGNAHEILSAAHAHGVYFTAGWPSFVVRLLGVLELVEGRPDAAASVLEEALRIARDGGARPEEGRSAFDLARALSLRNADGDRRRAEDVLNDAMHLLSAHCPDSILGRAERLLAYLETENRN